MPMIASPPYAVSPNFRKAKAIPRQFLANALSESFTVSLTLKRRPNSMSPPRFHWADSSDQSCSSHARDRKKGASSTVHLHRRADRLPARVSAVHVLRIEARLAQLDRG